MLCRRGHKQAKWRYQLTFSSLTTLGLKQRVFTQLGSNSDFRVLMTLTIKAGMPLTAVIGNISDLPSNAEDMTAASTSRADLTRELGSQALTLDSEIDRLLGELTDRRVLEPTTSPSRAERPSDEHQSNPIDRDTLLFRSSLTGSRPADGSPQLLLISI
jgi:hypothetical protein